MTRNLDRRVESAVLIDDPRLTARLQAILDICLQDDCGVRDLRPDGTYVRRKAKTGDRSHCAFARLCAEAAAQASPAAGPAAVPTFRPRRKASRRR